MVVACKTEELFFKVGHGIKQPTPKNVFNDLLKYQLELEVMCDCGHVSQYKEIL